jgi:hypothetical protein
MRERDVARLHNLGIVEPPEVVPGLQIQIPIDISSHSRLCTAQISILLPKNVNAEMTYPSMPRSSVGRMTGAKCGL